MSRRKKGHGVWAHGCPICGQRYEARGVMVVGPRGGLKARAGNSEPCVTCVRGERVAWWPEARLPKDCCRKHSRLITPDTHKHLFEETYQLCPDYPWYECQVCFRTHPRHDPTKETDDDAASRAERARREFRERVRA